MRPSNRSKILDAALRVVEREGVAAVTYDAVAQESGLTRGGMIYHFPSREALLLAIHQHLASEWEAMMVEHAGKLASKATPKERLVAYLKSCNQSASKADLQLYLEATVNPEFAEPWHVVMERWIPRSATAPEDSGGIDALVARLAADGLWMNDSLSAAPLSAKTRKALLNRIIELIE